MATEAGDLSALIDQHIERLAKPGVLSVRPGYKVKNDWLTHTRSIVVTARHIQHGQRSSGRATGVFAGVLRRVRL
jgi:hypothetical protein